LNWTRRSSNSKFLLKKKKLRVENPQGLNKRMIVHIILRHSKFMSVSFKWETGSSMYVFVAK